MNKAERKLVQVNVRLFEDDVESVKALALKDRRSYHALLRELVSEALRRRTKVEIR